MLKVMIAETTVSDEKDYICRVSYSTDDSKTITLQTDVATVYVIRKFPLYG